MIDNVLAMTALADELEAFIVETIPNTEIVPKYGGKLFTLRPDEKEGQYCGIFIYTKHVQISFSNGARIEDPKRLLLGSGEFRRHINFSSADQVNFEELKKLLEQASRL